MRERRLGEKDNREGFEGRRRTIGEEGSTLFGSALLFYFIYLLLLLLFIFILFFYYLRIEMKFVQLKILSYPISQNENFYTVQNPNIQINSLIELKKIIIK